ncbi:MAG: DUF393 domain-containing protein [Leptolyngbya sp. SIO3F4]|nr:DUF393 domain-containing protein [Leptolyngbya sp. SIO3F4]
MSVRTPVHEHNNLPPGGESAPVIYFDGVCHLCQASVQRILRWEAHPTLRFASLQGVHGQRLPGAQELDSVVLEENGVLYQKSEAAFRIIRYFRSPYRWIRVFRFLPRTWTDAVYDFIARHRYRWFGKSDACMVPSPGWKDRFLD